MTTGRKLGNSRLRFYTYKLTMCRVYDRKIPENKENQHFMRSHPEIYYTEYPGRIRIKAEQEVS